MLLGRPVPPLSPVGQLQVIRKPIPHDPKGRSTLLVIGAARSLADTAPRLLQMFSEQKQRF